METRALPFGIKIDVGNVFEADFSKGDISGVLFQYPDTEGSVHDFSQMVERAKKHGVTFQQISGKEQVSAVASSFRRCRCAPRT